jgi:hypothetical protein
MVHNRNIIVKKTKILLLAAISVLLTVEVQECESIVRHIVDQPVGRPIDELIGKWGSNASCVPIGPSHVLTTRHQGGSAGTAVRIGSQSYTVQSVANIGSADIRVAKITAADGSEANLQNYASIYRGSGEVGRAMTITGCGKVAGDRMTYNGKSFGYQWADNESGSANRCTNIIDGIDFKNTTYNTEVLTADFDGPGRSDATFFEGMPAVYDSGGGWFIYESQSWYVVGLNRAVEHGGASVFAREYNPDVADADYFDAVRVSAYSSEILGLIESNVEVPEPGSLLLIGGGMVLLLKRK